VARGRSGFIPHLVCAAMFAPGLWMASSGDAPRSAEIGPAVTVFLLTSLVYSFIGGVRRGRRVLVASFAALTGALTALTPLAVLHSLTFLQPVFGIQFSSMFLALSALVISCFASAFIFGSFLALLTRVGLEHTQAFTALDHPGFKHFLRLRVRRDADRIDGWCLGLTDPLGEAAEPELVDQFSFSAREITG
jgi:hypothetical protein